MKYIKTFEKINDGSPQAGDYVICDSSVCSNRKEYVETHLGRIDHFVTDNNSEDDIINIRYNNTKQGKSYFRRKDILNWSNDKQEMKELLINMIRTKKYNL